MMTKPIAPLCIVNVTLAHGGHPATCPVPPLWRWDPCHRGVLVSGFLQASSPGPSRGGRRRQIPGRGSHPADLCPLPCETVRVLPPRKCRCPDDSGRCELRRGAAATGPLSSCCLSNPGVWRLQGGPVPRSQGARGASVCPGQCPRWVCRPCGLWVPSLCVHEGNTHHVQGDHLCAPRFLAL